MENIIVNNIKKILFPPRCPGCDGLLSPGSERCFCPDCVDRVEKICDREYKKNLLCLYLYEGVMKKSMYRFKYLNRRSYIETFLEVSEKETKEFIEKNRPEVVIPVPMYPPKKRKRGYNQAEVISSAISKRFSIPEDRDLLYRSRETKALKKMTPQERTNNLKNAFKIRGNSIKWKRILLVDDIYTTGATLSASATVLLNAGAEAVFSVCICGSGRILGG